MLKYRMIAESNNKLLYEYTDNDSREAGRIVFNKDTGESTINKCLPEEVNGSLAYKIINKLQCFSAVGKYETEGEIY